MCDETRSIDATDVVPKPAQLSHKIGGLMNECFGTAIEQFDSAAKVLKARRGRGRIVVDLARVQEINADQFERGDHRVAVRDVMLALPLADGAR